MDDYQLYCRIPGHDKIIEGICLSKQCKSQMKIFCIICLRNNHSTCGKDACFKQEFLSRLITTKDKAEQPKQIYDIQEKKTKLFNSIKDLDSLLNKVLEKYESVSRSKRVDWILQNQNMLQLAHWNQGYDLLTQECEVFPQCMSDLAQQLAHIKRQVDSVTMFQQQELAKLGWNTITTQKPLQIQTKHKILTIALSPNHQQIASAGFDDEQIQIWNPITGEQIGQSLKGHTKNINSIKYSRCGNYLVSASEDTTIRQWIVATQQEFGQVLKGHKDIVYEVQYSPDQRQIVSSSRDKTIRVWDAKTGQEKRDKQINNMDITLCLSLAFESTYVAFGAELNKILIWDYQRSCKVGEPLKGHQDRVSCLQYSRDDKLIVSGGADQTIRIWNVQNREQIAIFTGHTSSVFTVCFSPDLKYIISAGHDLTVRLWSRETGNQVGKNLSNHQEKVLSALFSLDGTYIITGGQDRLLRIMIAPIEDEDSGCAIF